MAAGYKNILIIADIEGSSGCFNYEDSRLFTKGWSRACRAMSRDVDAVCRALYGAGVGLVTVKDFHRTGYNLLPEMIDPRARIVHGYKRGPVPGLGEPGGAEAVMFLGLHAPSGANGFLAHTLTSRIEKLEVNGRLMAEIQLFAASLAPYGIRPIFFSGCPAACAQAGEVIKDINCFAIEKPIQPEQFDAREWRFGLAAAAVRSLNNTAAPPYEPRGPFSAEVTMRGGPRAAQKIARRWNLHRSDARLFFQAPDMNTLFLELAKLAYLNRLTQRLMGPALGGYNLLGRLGLSWVRRTGPHPQGIVPGKSR